MLFTISRGRTSNKTGPLQYFTPRADENSLNAHFYTVELFLTSSVLLSRKRFSRRSTLLEEGEERGDHLTLLPSPRLRRLAHIFNPEMKNLRVPSIFANIKVDFNQG